MTKEGLDRMVTRMCEEPIPSHHTPPISEPLPPSLPSSHPHKSHPAINPSAVTGVFPTATDPLPLSSSSSISSGHVVRPLSLSTTPLPPVTSATPVETPPSVIGPTAHLAGDVAAMSRESHMISRGVSHDRGKEHLFSPSLSEDDQMRQIEKVCCLFTFKIRILCFSGVLL